MKISLTHWFDFFEGHSSDSKKSLSSENIQALSHRMTALGLEVESVQAQGEGLDHVVIGRVVSCEKHPQADKLSVCQVEIGNVAGGSSSRQIVCGASNVRAGIKVAVALEGAQLPNGMAIKATRLRGVDSQGMICSLSELGIEESVESHGIWILPDEAVLGSPLRDFLGLNDVVMEIATGPNRGDLLSYFGLARELSPWLGLALKPWSAWGAEKFLSSQSVEVRPERVQSAQACSVYTLTRVRLGAVSTPVVTPEFILNVLKAANLRSIHPVVDVTNFILLTWGVPLHAFDASSVSGDEIRNQGLFVRFANPGESLKLLNGQTVELQSTDMIIADQQGPVALAGIMGGLSSEVQSSTQEILLEAACFDRSVIRSSRSRLQIHTEASQRYERGVDPQAILMARALAVKIICDLYPGSSSETLVSHLGVQKQSIQASSRIEFLGAEVEALLGLALPQKTIELALKTLGLPFHILEGQEQQARYSIQVPSYRFDLEGSHDIMEEILRFVGHDQVPSLLPPLPSFPQSLGVEGQEISKAVRKELAYLRTVRSWLSDLGFHEAINFAFTSREMVENFSWQVSTEKLTTLVNPLNESFSTLKDTLLPGLLENLGLAHRHQSLDVRLYEIRNVFSRNSKSATGVDESLHLSWVSSGRSFKKGLKAQDPQGAFYEQKALIEQLGQLLSVRGLRVLSVKDAMSQKIKELDQQTRCIDKGIFHPYLTFAVVLGNRFLGWVGQLHPTLVQKMKFRNQVHFCELNLDPLISQAGAMSVYTPQSAFPSALRQISVVVPLSMKAEEVRRLLFKHGKPLLESLEARDVYTGENLTQGTKSLSFDLVFSSRERTLGDQEVQKLCDDLIARLQKDLGVDLRKSQS